MLGDDMDSRRCEVCGQLKNRREVQVHESESSDSETTLDHIRDLIGGSSSGANDQENASSGTSEKVDTDNEGDKIGTFYICSDLSCDSREKDIRDIERWRLENDPSLEFSEEILDEIVQEIVERDKKNSQIKDERVESVYERLVQDESMPSDQDEKNVDDA